MDKRELVDRIVSRSKIDRDIVVIIVDNFMLEVRESLKRHENVYLRGFGTFAVKHRKKCIGRNVSANIPVEIPERYSSSFKPSKDMRVLQPLNKEG